MPDLQTYLDLIAPEHSSRPDFVGLLTTLLQPLIDSQSFFGDLLETFDVDTAIGVQLDAVGQWVGVSRQVAQPLAGVYFSFDTASLGFDQGVWKGPFDPTTGVTSLPDDVYRALIKAKIIMNNWDGTIGTIARAINALFEGQPASSIVVIDNQDMTMTVGISGNAPATISLSLLTGGYIPIRPSGVLLNYLVTGTPTLALFGFDVQNTGIAGFDLGSFSGSLGTLPGQVLGLGLVDTGSTSVTVSWLPDTVGSGPFTYQVQYELMSAPGIFITSGIPVFQTQATIVGLSPNVAYGFQVFAINSAGPGLPSNVLVVTTNTAPPATVTGLTLVSSTPTTVNLSWNAVAGSSILYQPQFRISGSTAYTNVGGTIPTTSIQVPGLSPGVNYDFTVFAINANGAGPICQPVSGGVTGLLPGVIQNLAVGTITASTVQVTWSQPTTNNGPYNYTLQFAQNVNPIAYQTFTGAITTTGATSVATVTGLQPALPYLFRVSASNTNGNGPNSTPVNATTLSGAVGQVPSLTTGTITSTTVVLNWTAATGAATYQMQYQLVGTQTWTNGGSPVGALTGTITGLTGGNTYNFQVFGLDSNSVAGPPSPVATATTTGSVPTQVTGLVASAPTINSITLVWNASTGVPASIVYQPQYRITGSVTWTNFGVAIVATTEVITGLQSNQSYDFQVFGTNNAGQGTPSSSVTLSTTGTVTTATWNPSDHTSNITLSNNNLTATAVASPVPGLGVSQTTETSMIVTWAAPALLGSFAVRGTTALSSGKHFIEYTITSMTLTYLVGLANASFSFANSAGLGSDINSLGILPENQGAFVNGTKLAGLATTDATGDTVSVAYDFNSMQFWYTTQAMRSVLGVNAWNCSSFANPSTGVGGLPMSGLTPGPYFPAFNSTITSCACTINAGDTPFVITLPTGFAGWNGTGGSSVNPPSQIFGLAAGAPTYRSIPLTWAVPTVGGPVTSYQLSFRKTGTSAWYIGAITTQPNTVVINLLSSTSYDFMVDATGPGGAGPVSNIITATTSAPTNSILTYRGLNISGSDLTQISTLPTVYPHANAVIIPVFCSTASQVSTDVVLTVTLPTIAGWVDAANAAGLEVFLAVSLTPRDGSPGNTITPGPSLLGVSTFFQNLEIILQQVAQMGSAHSALGMWCTGIQPWAGTAAGDTGPYSAAHVSQWQSIYQICKASWTNGIIAYSAPQTAIGLAQSQSPFSANWFIWDAIVFDVFPGSSNASLTVPQFEFFFDNNVDPDPNTQAATGPIPLFQALVNFANQQGRRLIINSCGIIPADGNQLAPGSRGTLPPPFDFLMQSAWWVSVMNEVVKNVGVFAGFFAYDGGANGFNSPFTGIDYYGIGGQPAGGNIDTVYSGLIGTGPGGLVAPGTLNVSGVTPNTLTLSWNAIAGPSITYVAQISVHGANSFTSLSPTIATSVTFTGLLSTTAYDLQVFAQQGALIGPTSIIIIGTTTGTGTGQPTITITTPAIPVAGNAPFTVAGTLSGFGGVPALFYIDDGNVPQVTGISLTSATSSSLAVTWSPITAATQVPITGTTLTAFSFNHPAMPIGSHAIAVTNGTQTASKTYTVGFVVSPDRTVVLAGSSNLITDNGGNTWGITSGNQVSINGAVDSTSANCIEIAWVSGIIWYENSAGQWRSRSSPANAWSAPTNVSPLGGTQIITVTVPTGIQLNATYVVSGSLTGYSVAPTLNYIDDAGTSHVFPIGAAVSTTAYSFTHPAGLAIGSHSIAVVDASNTLIKGTTNYTIAAGAIVPINHPLTGATVGTWQTGNLTLNGITTTYMYLLPFNYDGTQFSYPLMLYLHSIENTTLSTIQTELNAWVNTAAWRNVYPSIVIAPILSAADLSAGTYWGGMTAAASPSGSNAIALVQQFVSTFSVTPNQTYCVGYEYGAVGAWDIVVKYNRQTGTLGKLIDAFLPIGGSLFTAGSPTPTTTVVTALANVPIFGIFGFNDTLIDSTWERNLYVAYGGSSTAFTGSKATNSQFWLLRDDGLGAGQSVANAYLTLPTGKLYWDWLFYQSPVMFVTPGPVTNIVKTTATPTSVTISWAAPTTGQSPFTYHVFYSLIATGPWTQVGGTITNTNFTVTGLGELPGPVSGITGGSITSSSVTVGWNAATGLPQNYWFSVVAIGPDDLLSGPTTIAGPFTTT